MNRHIAATDLAEKNQSNSITQTDESNKRLTAERQIHKAPKFPENKIKGIAAAVNQRNSDELTRMEQEAKHQAAQTIAGTKKQRGERTHKNEFKN